MIDIHSHVLYNIDDGSRSREESIAILKKMSSIGFRNIVATPHYITGSSFKCNNSTKNSLIKELQDTLNSEDIKMTLFPGNEVYIDNEILTLYASGEISCINGSRYMLIELPRNGKINDLDNLIFKLRSKDIVPIIAHPERYIFFQENPLLMNRVLETGAYFQCNFESINGKYGKDTKKLALYILNHNLCHFLASDIHHIDSEFFNNFKGLANEIIKMIGKEKFIEITHTNPLHVLKGEIFEVSEPIIEKPGLFKNIFKK